MTKDPLVRRLRGLMIGAILFSVAMTLAGQPPGFWTHPQSAMRGDGLSIYAATNHTFDFFLGRGWPAYLGATLVYLVAAAVAVSLLPRTPALIAIFSVIFAHFYGAQNWLAVRWHLGFSGAGVYAGVLATAIALLSEGRMGGQEDRILRRLRWVLAAALALDSANTLIGQPASFWLHPETCHEGNPIWQFFLSKGWYAYLAGDFVYGAAIVALVTRIPRPYGFIVFFGFLFGHFLGGSNWFFYEWRMGLQAVVAYGCILSAAIVLLGYSRCTDGDRVRGGPRKYSTRARSLLCGSWG